MGKLQNMEAKIIHASFGRLIWTRTLPRDGNNLRCCAIASRRPTTTEKQAIKLFCYQTFALNDWRMDEVNNVIAFRSVYALNRFLTEFNKSS